jgi:hypothetical protein
MLTLAGSTTITEKQMNTNQIPVEQTLDPGESVVPSSAVDVMTSILALSGPPEEAPAQQESDVSIATLILFSLIAFLIIRVILRFLPWVLGLGVVFALLAIL